MATAVSVAAIVLAVVVVTVAAVVNGGDVNTAEKKAGEWERDRRLFKTSYIV